jgi:uncharacterized protein YbjQ (UPF0145 family)
MKIMNNVIVTMTNSIENSSIQEYIELISVNVVIGANLFSDFLASFTDIFGGYSDTYQNKLQNIYKVAISNLTEQASRIGANAIVGLKIDFDEISGKGKSMFMVSAIGMAVSVNFTSQSKYQSEPNFACISGIRLEKEINKRIIIKQLSENKLPTEEQWLYLLNNHIDEIVQDLLHAYLKSFNEFQDMNKQGLLQDNFVEYIKQINQDVAIGTLYSNINLDFQKIWDLLNSASLFSPQKVLDLIKNNNISIGIKCLPIKKDFYTQEDLVLMRNIISELDSLPDVGVIEVTKDGLLSKGKERFICKNGHKNNVEEKFCQNENCGIDIKGLTQKDYPLIEQYKLKVDSLDFLINK